MRVWDEVNKRWILKWADPQNLPVTPAQSEYTRSLSSPNYPTVYTDTSSQNYDATPYQPTQSSAFSQDYSTVQSYTSSQTQPAASDLTSSTGYNAGYDTTYSAEPAYKSQAYSMPVDTTYAANSDPGTAYGAHSSHEKGKAVDRAPAPTQGGQSSWLPDTAGVTTQMYGEPEDMALDTTPFYSEDHYAGNRRGSGSGSGSFGSSKPVQYDYTESMDKVSVRCSYKVPVVDPHTQVSDGSGTQRECNAIAAGRRRCVTHDALDSQHPMSFQTLLMDYQQPVKNYDGSYTYVRPTPKPMVRLPSGAFVHQKCDNGEITEQFYCTDCRPTLLICSYGLAQGLCGRKGQPELHPHKSNEYIPQFQDFWNCPAHKTHAVQGP